MPGGQPSNGLGTAALVLGIISVVSGIIPFLFWLAWILGILAVIFGAIGRGKAKRGEATNAGAALGGLITGIAGIVVGTLIFIFIVATFGRAARDISNDLTRYNNCLARNSGNPDRFTICNRG
jgi:hypothetical protein